MKDNKLYFPNRDLGRKCLLDLLSKDKEFTNKYIELGGNVNVVFRGDKIILANRKKIEEARVKIDE